MADFNAHVRNMFLAGIFVVAPVGVTIFLVWKVEMITRGLTEYFIGRPIPVVGILATFAVTYLTGLIVSSLVGKWFLLRFDRLLSKVPGLNTLYRTWKQIALTPGGTEGTFSKVVLIPSEVGGVQIAFTSARPVDGQASVWCVFVPAAPNPLSGRLHFVESRLCKLLDCSPEEAFKALISTGNYVPTELGAAIGKAD